MARTTLTKTVSPGRWSLTGTAITMAAADVANGNQFAAVGDMLIVAHNTDASPHTVTISSVADQRTGRTGDVNAQSVAAGAIRVFRISPAGWKQSDGYVYVNANDATIYLGVITL